jgi:PleD family two-component response regulator
VRWWPGVTVTVSLGATLLQPGDSPETLVRRADQLMYRSKEAGRNRVTAG